MSIALPELAFGYDALEPVISRRTMEIHYDRHHRSYVEKTNRMIEDTSFAHKDLEDILLHSKELDINIYNNAAQAWNHAFFWNCLSPKSNAPTSHLKSELVINFSSFDSFQNEFERAGRDLFGSGWVWLVRDSNQKLKIRALSNAENPLLDDETPLLVCDVWEHAYYLDYENQRDLYLKRFWEIVNWEFIESRLDLPPRRALLGKREKALTKDESQQHTKH